MGLGSTAPYKRVPRRRKRYWDLTVLFERFSQLPSQSGAGPIFTVAGLLVAVTVFMSQNIRKESEELVRQASVEYERLESSLSKIQTDIVNRIPAEVRSPLPIAPENGQTLAIRLKGESAIIELEWADRDEAHRHRYLLQLRCIAAVSPSGSLGKHDEIQNCQPQALNADVVSGWTEPGEDRIKVEIRHAGTYAWRIARGEVNDRGEITTIFEEWSPYYIFTVFESTKQRREITRQVRIGVLADHNFHDKDSSEKGGGKSFDLLKHEKEMGLRDQIKDKLLEEEPHKRAPLYFHYATHESLLAAVRRGEVDYAIGGLTRAKYREERGVLFTRGYAYARPIFISKSGRKKEPPWYGATIGVLSGSINAQALNSLTREMNFRVVPESSFLNLADALNNGSVDFIFTEERDLQQLTPASHATSQSMFRKAGTLYSHLRTFYQDQLGYTPQHAIATADMELCNEIDALMARNNKLPSISEFAQQLETIYEEEGETIWSSSVFWRVVDEFFINKLSFGDEQTCVEQ